MSPALNIHDAVHISQVQEAPAGVSVLYDADSNPGDGAATRA